MKKIVLMIAVFLVYPLLAADGAPAGLPTVTFTFDFPGSTPEHYSIRIRSDNSGSYESRVKLAEDAAEADPFVFDFRLQDATREKIFDLTSKTNFFSGQIDYTKGRLANTGKKVLAYHDDHRDQQATFNYSTIPAVQELTRVFQNLAATLEYARRLQFAHQYQRLALEEELKRMEDSAKSNSLGELQVLAPILQKIVADQSVLNVSRVRAQRLLERASQQ